MNIKTHSTQNSHTIITIFYGSFFKSPNKGRNKTKSQISKKAHLEHF